MRTDELYIDGELVDLDEDTKITLNLNSNIFTEVSKIVSNNSYTIKLPKTVRNQKIIGYSNSPAHIDDFPYENHAARYFRSGVEIIPNGVAVLLTVSDKIEITLVWGCYTNLKSLIDDGLSINELTGDDKIYFEENNLIEAYPNTKDYFYTYINYRKYEDSELSIDTIDRTRPTYSNRDDSCPMNPVVRVSWILKKIEEQTGVAFNFTGTNKDIVDSLLIPLTERKANELTFGKNMTCKVEDRNGFGDLQYTIVSGGLDSFETNTVGVTALYFKAKAAMTVRFKFSALVTFHYTDNKQWETWKGISAKIKIVGYVDVYGNLVEVENKETLMASPSLLLNDFKGNNTILLSGYCDVPLLAGQLAKMDVEISYSVLKVLMEDVKVHDASIIVAPNIPDEVPVKSYYPIISNLPEIKVIDLLKALCALTGVFAKQNKQDDGEITFLSIDDIYNNISKAKNWTKRVVASYRDNEPKEISFKVSDNYARNNYYKWKEDDTVKGDYDGDLEVNNKSLDYEKEIITMPFAATDGCNIPVYTKSTDDAGVVTYTASSVKPRLLKEIGGVYFYGSRRYGDASKSLSYGIFDGMDFNTILSNRYKKLSSILQTCKIIKENILVSEIDLKDFDESIPVYLGQYGKYYAIISMKAEDTGIAEVELLQL
jgi:hypothetical protein